MNTARLALIATLASLAFPAAAAAQTPTLGSNPALNCGLAGWQLCLPAPHALPRERP
jgi:hypothetical protein